MALDISTILGGVAGDLIGGIFGSSAQKKANATNIRLQRENQAWMEHMSNTSYQRAIEDMKAAGLNPMLAVSQGGASTPSSSAATVNPVDALARGVTSAGGKAMQAVSLQQGLANIDLTKAQTDKARAEAEVSAASVETDIRRKHWDSELVHKTIEKVIQDMNLTEEQRTQLRRMGPLLADASKAETLLKQLQVPSAKAEAEMWNRFGEVGKEAGAARPLIDIIKQIVLMLRSKK